MGAYSGRVGHGGLRPVFREKEVSVEALPLARLKTAVVSSILPWSLCHSSGARLLRPSKRKVSTRGLSGKLLFFILLGSQEQRSSLATPPGA